MINKLKLIGLHGPAGCGKDTIAKFLCDTQEFRQIALAQPIMNGISAMFGLPVEYLTDLTLREQPLDLLCGKTPQVMQTLGAEWGRNHICLDVWLKIAQREIDYQNGLVAANNLYLRGIVVSDIRLESEAKWLRDQGGTIWHIHRRPDNPHAIATDHESETPIWPMSGEPFVINDGDIDQLHDRIAQLIETTTETA